MIFLLYRQSLIKKILELENVECVVNILQWFYTIIDHKIYNCNPTNFITLPQRHTFPHIINSRKCIILNTCQNVDSNCHNDYLYLIKISRKPYVTATLSKNSTMKQKMQWSHIWSYHESYKNCYFSFWGMKACLKNLITSCMDVIPSRSSAGIICACSRDIWLAFVSLKLCVIPSVFAQDKLPHCVDQWE